MEIKEIDIETANKLYEHLYSKTLDEKTKLQPWKCENCWFMNRKLLIGKLWRFYNMSFQCGLCGESRINDHLYPNTKSLTNNKSAVYTPYLDEIKEEMELPKEILFDWKHISKQECLADYRLGLNTLSLSMIGMITSEDDSDSDDDDKLKGIDMMDAQRSKSNNNLLTANESLLCSPLSLSQTTSVTLYEFKNCTVINRISVILKHFHDLTEKITQNEARYPYEIKTFLSKLTDYNAIKLIDDVDHLLRYHHIENTINYDELYKYGILCEEQEDCIYFKRSQRETHTFQTIKDKQDLFHTDHITDFVYISVLDRAHILLLHQNDGKTSKLLRKDTEIIAKYGKYPVYSTGVFMQYDALTPLHLNLREELTKNRLCNIKKEQWKQALEKAKVFMQSANGKGAWRSNETNLEHGIEKNDPIQMEHILSIICYCDFTELCEAFRCSYRRKPGSDETDLDVEQKHIFNFYWFGRFVYGAIQFCGDKPSKPATSFKKMTNKNRPFYHGLTQKFLFSMFSAIYEIPTSTTWDLSVAQRFATNNGQSDNGIILELGPKYKNEVNYSRCLDVSTISDFTAEKERLFAGMSELAIINIIDLKCNDEEKLETQKYMKVILYFERIIEQTTYQKDYYNYGHLKKKENEWQNIYLVPLIKKQINRNINDNDDNDNDEKETEININIPPYICALFEHFCDSKTDYINLSCIKSEIDNTMHEELQKILFINDTNNNQQIINNEAIKNIFPKLKKYKNPLDHWITLRDGD